MHFRYIFVPHTTQGNRRYGIAGIMLADQEQKSNWIPAYVGSDRTGRSFRINWIIVEHCNEDRPYLVALPRSLCSVCYDVKPASGVHME